MTRSNRSRPIRHRRTSAEMEEVRSAIYTAVAADHPMTVRQVFYRLVSQGVIAKTEAEYKATVVRQRGIIGTSGAPGSLSRNRVRRRRNVQRVCAVPLWWRSRGLGERNLHVVQQLINFLAVEVGGPAMSLFDRCVDECRATPAFSRPCRAT